MTPDELRALADTVNSIYAETYTQREAIDSVVAYLRACADARLAASAIQTRLGERPIISGWDESTFKLNEEVALYTHPAPAAPHPAVQSGWQLVPVKPTLSMNSAGLSAVNQYGKRLVWETYKAMLAAAPAAPQAEQKREPLSDEQIELPDYLRLQIASTAAAHDVLVERRRQIEVEGWTPEHDDEHVLGEMAALAAFYAVPDGVHEWDFSSTGYGNTLAEVLLPSGWAAKAGEDRRRDLVKAGALILAEIERLDRMGDSDAE